MLRRNYIFIIVITFFIISCLVNVLFFYRKGLHHSTSANYIKNKSLIDIKKEKRENACILIYGSEAAADEIIATITDLERQFNNSKLYPVIIIGDMTKRTKARIKLNVNLNVEFGKITKDSTINKDKIPPELDNESVQKRKLERFKSTLFSFHPLLLSYDYYWRIPPGVRFPCRIRFDPFKIMRENSIEFSPFFFFHSDKDNAFSIAARHSKENTDKFWNDAFDYFKNKYKVSNAKDKLLNCFKTDSDDRMKNDCVFNFDIEMGSFALWRSIDALNYFIHIDKNIDSFFHNDAYTEQNVRNAIVGFLCPQDKIYFFKELGIEYKGENTCPTLASCKDDCECDPLRSFSFSEGSCLLNLMK